MRLNDAIAELSVSEFKRVTGVELCLDIELGDAQMRDPLFAETTLFEETTYNQQLVESFAAFVHEPELLLCRVYVDDAGHMGRGLYARDDIQPSELVAIYHGVVVHSERIQQPNPYLVAYHHVDSCLNGLFCSAYELHVDLDALQRGGPARFINDGDSHRRNLDTHMMAYQGLFYPLFVARQHIPRGEQLLCDYGASYWR